MSATGELTSVGEMDGRELEKVVEQCWGPTLTAHGWSGPKTKDFGNDYVEVVYKKKRIGLKVSYEWGPIYTHVMLLVRGRIPREGELRGRFKAIMQVVEERGARVRHTERSRKNTRLQNIALVLEGEIEALERWAPDVLAGEKDLTFPDR